MRRVFGSLAALFIFLDVVPSLAAAQSSKRVILRVTVAEVPGGRLLEGVNVSVASDSGMLASATTDSLGRASIGVPPSMSKLHFLARRVGYQPAQTILDRSRQDTLSVDVELEPIAQQLDSVRTTARATSMNYALGAAEIAQSRRTILDAYDALRALRPNMLGDVMRGCPFVQDLWINGRRQPVYPNEIVPLGDDVSPIRDDGSARPTVRSSFPPFHAPRSAPLAMIRPEHIAEMRYVNCWSRPVAGMHSVNALFINLKPGVGFDFRHGSHVVDSAAARAAGIIR
jgi:hypothetical protein